MKPLLIVLLMTVFISCKRDNTVSKYVYNFTNDTITVNSNQEVYTLVPGDFRLVQTKVYADEIKGIPCEIDIEFTLQFSSGRSLVKSLDSTEAWEGSIDGNRHLFQECYFKIYEVDLQ